jgi:hypothetical protein
MEVADFRMETENDTQTGLIADKFVKAMKGFLIEGLNKENEIEIKLYEINDSKVDPLLNDLVYELDKRLSDLNHNETNYGKAKSL